MVRLNLSKIIAFLLNKCLNSQLMFLKFNELCIKLKRIFSKFTWEDSESLLICLFFLPIFPFLSVSLFFFTFGES